MFNGRIPKLTIVVIFILITTFFLFVTRENYGSTTSNNPASKSITPEISLSILPTTENPAQRSNSPDTTPNPTNPAQRSNSPDTGPNPTQPCFKCQFEDIPGTNSTQVQCQNKGSYQCTLKTGNDTSKCPLRLRKANRNYNCSNSEKFRKLMKMRRERLSTVCNSSRDKLHLSEGPPRELFHFHGVGDAGLTWCPVFKAASSNTNAFFCPLYYDQNKCDDKMRNGANIWRYSEFFPPDSAQVPRFIVVRDPFERILSAYRDKIEGPGAVSFLDTIYYKILGPLRLIPSHLIPEKGRLLWEARETADELLQSEENGKMKGRKTYISNSSNPYKNPLSATFSEFLRAVLTGTSNEHWLTVDSACAPCGDHAHYQYIIQVEDYDCEVNNMLGEVGARELQALHTEYRQTNQNPGRGPQGAMTDLYEYYGALPGDLLRAFYEWYKGDCEMFGYDCERTLCEIEDWRRRYKQSPQQ